MKFRSPLKLTGWLTAVLAASGLWVTVGRPFDQKQQEVPVEIHSRQESLSGLNVGGRALHEVEILGYDGKGMVRIHRKESWSPGEEINLGARAGWVPSEGAELEISANGYRTKKFHF